MNSTSSIALSGMNAAQSQLGVAAHNIANQSTLGFKRQTVEVATRPQGGVSTQLAQAPQAGNALETDVVGLMQAKHSFAANLAVFKTQDRMMGTMLNAEV